jgi:hypothetical protein
VTRSGTEWTLWSFGVWIFPTTGELRREEKTIKMELKRNRLQTWNMELS